MPDAPDFRTDAAAASVDMIGPTIVGPPLDLGLSLCHPVDDPPPLWRPLAVTLGSVVLGFTGLLGGAALAALSDDGGRAGTTAETVMLTVGVTCSLMGMATFFGGIFLNRGWVKRNLGDRYTLTMQQTWDTKPSVVQIEDAATFSKLKLTSEDMGVIAFDAERQAVLIEGLHYRYTVFFDDLIDIADVKGGNQLGTKSASASATCRSPSSCRGRTASATSCASKRSARRRPRSPTPSAAPSASSSRSVVIHRNAPACGSALPRPPVLAHQRDEAARLVLLPRQFPVAPTDEHR